jgi:hypothetical protein
MRERLHTTYIRFDTPSRSLARTALAQFLLKLIYIMGPGCSEKDLVTGVREELKATVDENRIRDSLRELAQEGKVVKKRGRISLDVKCLRDLEQALREHESRQTAIIERYFSKAESQLVDIRRWFEDVTITFFREYSGEWIAEVSRRTKAEKPRVPDIHRIASEVAARDNKLRPQDVEWLADQYVRFLESNDTDKDALLWDYGTSMFCASLITATTGADPLSLDLFAGATFILDTNVLMSLQLEGHHLAGAFSALETVLHRLGVKVQHFHITRDEYMRAMGNKKQEILDAVRKYPLDVVQGTRDPFIRTACMRGCVCSEDFETFFDELLRIPSTFGTKLEIGVLDHQTIAAAADAGQEDHEAVQRMNAIYKERRKHDKLIKSLRHDAGLIAGAMELRKSERCWVLTLDSTVRDYALESAIRAEYPIAISMQTLITVLAINNGGVDVDPADFIPLFGTIIRLGLIPEHGAFTVEDLSRMYEVQSQIADLPRETITDIARQVNRDRLAGISDDKIRLSLMRRFESERLKIVSDLDATKQQLQAAKSEGVRLEQQKAALRAQLKREYIDDLQDRYDSELRRGRIWWLVVLPVAILALTIFLTSLFVPRLGQHLGKICLGIGLELLGLFLGSKYFTNPKLVHKYSERTSHIEEAAESKVRASEQRQNKN